MDKRLTVWLLIRVFWFLIFDRWRNMKFSIILSEISRKLQEISGIASGSSTKKDDICQNIYIKVKDNQLTLKGTDYSIELSCVVPLVDVVTDGELTVSAAKLSGICSQMQGSLQTQFDYDETTEMLTISQADLVFSLRTRSAEEFTHFAEVQPEQSLTFKQSQLKHILDKCIFCVSNEEFRDYLKGVRFEAENQQLFVFASDGHRMSIIDSALPQPVTEKVAALITRKCAVELSKIVDDKSETLVQLNFSKDEVTCDCNGYHMISKLITCTYPNVHSVVPDHSEITIEMSKAELKSKLASTSYFASKRLNGVYMSFNAGKLTLTCENAEHDKATADLAIDYNGQPIEASFNASYIKDILGAIDEERVRFNFNMPITNTMITPVVTENSVKDINDKFIVSKILM
ncbi:MAG TPA: DNA polymerase III subunit beta [Succinivibrionaceae bacterium]|nr:DNA polymerase III subunit beta [Succinivibrionaceae bacterium]